MRWIDSVKRKGNEVEPSNIENRVDLAKRIQIENRLIITNRKPLSSRPSFGVDSDRDTFLEAIPATCFEKYRAREDVLACPGHP